MIIHLGQQLPADSSDLPESTDGPSLALSYSVLLRMGFTKLSRSPGKLVSSYLAFSPLPPGRIPDPHGDLRKIGRAVTVFFESGFHSGGIQFAICRMSLNFPLPLLAVTRLLESLHDCTFTHIGYAKPSDVQRPQGQHTITVSTVKMIHHPLTDLCSASRSNTQLYIGRV